MIKNHKTVRLRRVYCCNLLLLIFTLPLTAQDLLVTGKVTDGQLPISGANVLIKNTKSGVVTGFDGRYTITAQPTDTLQISYLGYSTVTVSVQGRTIINVALQEDFTALGEVQINAGYYTTTDRERTGNIEKITSKDIEKQPVPNILGTLHGRMAGVDIVQDGGTPGGAFTIRIRGLNSLRSEGNQPLYIIDGVPYAGETIGSTDTSGTFPTLSSPLNSINPMDIESIEILKDADATAIYGSRGANGVVLITTKRGATGKTKFKVNTSTGVGSVTRLPKMMNTQQYLSMREQGFTNDGIETYPSNAYDINGTWDRSHYTNWQKKFIGGIAQIQQVQVSAEGGGTQTSYMVSGQTRNETTVFPGDYTYTRAGGQFNMHHRSLDDKFQLRFTAGYTIQKNNLPANDLTRISRRLAPNAPVLYDDEGNLNWENSTWENPLAQMESQFQSHIKDLNISSLMSYNFRPDLQFRLSLGYTDLNNEESRTFPSTMHDPAYGVGSEVSSIYAHYINRTSWIAEPQLQWNRSIGKGVLTALLGSTFQQQQTNRLTLFGAGFSSNNLIYNLSSAQIRNIEANQALEYNYMAFFGRLNYNWDGKYILNLTGRRDGSSRFGPSKQFANFGAVGGAWVFSEENWMQNISFLNFGKLRGSYGITGNDQIGDYQYLDTYSSSGISYQGKVGLQPARLYNPVFGWESNRKFETALDLGFFGDRLFLTTAFYLNRSSSQLVGIPMPGTTGFTTLTGNLDATVENRGTEFTLRSQNIQKKDFEWLSSFTFSTNRNKLLSYPGLENSSFANTYVVGQPISIIKLYHFTGINPDTGLYEFEDFNADGTITSVGDRQAVVDLNPQFFGGFQNQIRFKQFQFDFMFHFVKQQTRGYFPGLPGTFVNQLAGVSQENPLPAYSSGANSELITGYNRYTLSDATVQDASFIRLKNVSLTYQIPLESKKFQCQLYFQGQNLLTITKYYFGDPEFKFNNYLPPLKVYTLGVNLQF